jgi:hypothetical protein
VLRLYGNSGYLNTLESYVIHTLPIYFYLANTKVQDFIISCTWMSQKSMCKYRNLSSVRIMCMRYRESCYIKMHALCPFCLQLHYQAKQIRSPHEKLVVMQLVLKTLGYYLTPQFITLILWSNRL